MRDWRKGQHVNLVGGGGGVSSTLVTNYEGKRVVGRAMLRWKENIRMIFNEI
jgi:hypothetical protein